LDKSRRLPVGWCFGFVTAGLLLRKDDDFNNIYLLDLSKQLDIHRV